MGTSFKFEAPNGIPRMIRRGEDQTLDVTWFEDNAAIVGPVVSASFTLKQGSTVLTDDVRPRRLAAQPIRPHTI